MILKGLHTSIRIETTFWTYLFALQYIEIHDQMSSAKGLFQYSPWIFIFNRCVMNSNLHKQTSPWNFHDGFT